MTDLGAFGIGIDHPGHLRAAGKKILEPSIDLSASIVRGEDFDGQIRSAGEETAGSTLETQTDQPGPGHKRNVWGAAVAVLHPKPSAGIQNDPKAALRDKIV